MSNLYSEKKFRFAIDRGGTFTDIVCDVLVADNSSNPNKLSSVKTIIHKLLSVNPHYEDAPLEGIRQIISKELQISSDSLKPIPSE
jgi:5-oxoprolinase (ATP-hydrolysing)